MPDFKFTTKRKAALKKAQKKSWSNKRSRDQLRLFAAARLTYLQSQRAKKIIESKYKKVGLKE
jgi:predicted RNase H-like nuclease (RuvC/YqgF family)